MKENHTKRDAFAKEAMSTSTRIMLKNFKFFIAYSSIRLIKDMMIKIGLLGLIMEYCTQNNLPKREG